MTAGGGCREPRVPARPSALGVPEVSGLRETLTALRMTLVSWVICGLLFPLVIVGVGQALFRFQAQGSLLSGPSGQVVGSAHIGQAFTSPKWFWGRPSATNDPSTGKPAPYTANNSGGSNLGPTNPALRDEVKANLQAILTADPGVQGNQVPLDLIESSGSGLDPDITPASALLQVARVSQATGISPDILTRLVQSHVRGSFLVRMFGAPHVNVLELNLALWRLQGGR